MCRSELRVAAVCCSVMKYVAVCCSVLQCVAVCCGMYETCHDMNEVCHVPG